MDAITAAYDGDIQMIDSTSIRAHQEAVKAKRGARSLSRSLAVRLCLTAGRAHDGPPALGLLDRLEPHTVDLADKAHDAGNIRDLIEAQGAVPDIPAKSNRNWKSCFSKALQRERNQIERFFGRLKHFRCVATRYGKLAENFLAMAQLASKRLWLRACKSTA